MNNWLKKIEAYNSKKVLFIGLITWLGINLAQCFFTELAHDEAYYWMYSKYLDWGYFDHPPMIALLVKIGYFVFNNELGVRLLPSLMGIATLFVIYKLIPQAKSNSVLFLLIIFSIAIAQTHVVGFLAIPDVPIIFFSALFFFVLKKYLEQNTCGLAVLLGLIASAMLYSKYHAVLVLFFSVLPNLKLFKRTSFYVIPVIVIVCLLPHLFWQINHNFPTFEYHLVSRASAYTPLHTWNYIYSQVLIAGPFVAIPLFYHAIKSKGENRFEKTMKFNFIGFFVFFFIMSFRGHIEAHWTAIGFVPLIVLAFKQIAKSNKAKLWLYRLSIPSISILIFARLALIVQIFPPEAELGKEFHNWDTWAREIQQTADGRKVVFTNTFQRPSKYQFYTGEFATSVNNILYRKNQFDIWPLEDSLLNTPVIVFGCMNATNRLETATGEKYKYALINDYLSYRDIKVIPNKKHIAAKITDSLHVMVDIVNTGNSAVRFTSDNGLTTFLTASYANKEKLFNALHIHEINKNELSPGDTLQLKCRFKAPDYVGNYKCYIALRNKYSYPGFNTVPINVSIE